MSLSRSAQPRNEAADGRDGVCDGGLGWWRTTGYWPLFTTSMPGAPEQRALTTVLCGKSHNQKLQGRAVRITTHLVVNVTHLHSHLLLYTEPRQNADPQTDRELLLYCRWEIWVGNRNPPCELLSLPLLPANKFLSPLNFPLL